MSKSKTGQDTAAMFGIEMPMLDEVSSMDGSFGFSFDTNGLWLEITNVFNGLACANLHNGGTNSCYAICSSTDLAVPFTNWPVESVVFPASTTAPFAVETLGRPVLFLRVTDITGLDSDGDLIPDWWAWRYFGTNNLIATNLDYSGNGYTFAEEYSNNIPPTVFTFTGIEAADEYVHSSPAPMQLEVGGLPYSVAVLVDNEDYSNAVWNVYSGSTVSVELGSEGWHEVWIGLRGHGDDPSVAVWQWKRLKFDTTPPALAITSPANSAVDVPMIQLIGYSPETLASISYDLANANGLLTNQPVLVTDRYFDTNLWDFTTNTFQAFDVPLAEGLNTFTLYATDPAGNVTVTNFSFTVDYSSKTNPPAVQIAWPQDRVKISGDTVTLQGQLDDPTATVYASITGTNGSIGTAMGLVERDGRFWLEELPLNGGSNVVSITVSNVVGQTSVTHFSVVRDSLNLTLAPPWDKSQLWQPTVSVSGTISGSGYAVWVNGVQANVTGGYWNAANVPTTPGGVAIFNVTAYPPGETPSGSTNGINSQTANSVNLYSEMDKPPRLYVAKYSDEEVENSDDAFYGYYNPEGVTHQWSDRYDHRTTIMDWADQGGGYSSTVDNAAGVGTNVSDANFLSVEQSAITWPASVWPSLPDGTHVYSNCDYYYDSQWTNITSGTDSWSLDIPLEHCYLKATEVSSWTEHHGGGYKAVYRHHLTFSRKAQTVMRLQTGGKAGVGRQSLFQLSASALGGWLIMTPYWDAQWGYFSYGTSIPIDATNITVMGQTLGADGDLYVALPDGMERDVTPVVVNSDYCSFNVSQTKIPVAIQANEIKLDPDSVTSGANFCVGQRINFSITGLPSYQYALAKWNLPGTFVNTNSDPNCNLFYDKNLSLLVRSSAANGTLSTFCWYASLEQPATASVTVYLTFNSRPAQFPYTATGQFNVHRPTVVDKNHYQDGVPTARIWSGSLSLGDHSRHNDMSFKHQINPGNFSGLAGYVQLITSADILTDPLPNPPNGIALDAALGEFPRGTPTVSANNNTWVEFYDAPGVGLPSSIAPVSEDVSFSTYLMFKPAGGIWVPLQLVTWELHDSATYNADQTWTPHNSTDKGTPEIKDDIDNINFPHWTTTY